MFEAVTSGLAAGSWQGPASTVMAAAAAPYAGWLSAAATPGPGSGQSSRRGSFGIRGGVGATVRPAALALNRSQLVSLVQSNLLGFNGPGDRGRRGPV
ncbi:PPE domain-containing protein [Mycobacterium riyadhense]|uniref:PPE domain-containing protein n=1 Tax=Mycobacterium riyadhense TaxID=486698 RepID=UPI002095E67F|nr:PPE domain-containing protein [Mycobacterium riyadhense]